MINKEYETSVAADCYIFHIMFYTQSKTCTKEIWTNPLLVRQYKHQEEPFKSMAQLSLYDHILLSQISYSRAPNHS